MSETCRFSRLGRVIECGANVGIVVVALMAGALMFRQAPARSSAPPVTRRAPAAGSALKLPDVTFRDADQTLVLVLSTACHFCSESGSFYRRIAGAARRHGTSIVAVLPQPTDEAAAYLAKLGVSVDKVYQLALTAVDTSGTPTLILVSRNGVVKKTWIGRLPADEEDEVLNAVEGLP